MYTIPHCPRRVLQIAATIFAFAASAHADIFQWEYINPADPSQGKRQSATLAPDGAGVDAVPGDFLSPRTPLGLVNETRNLTMAYLNGVDLSHATLRGANLQNASLVGANLSAANLSSFCNCPAWAMSPISADLTAADLSQANLTNANFAAAILTDTNFTDAEIRGANFAARSYYCSVVSCTTAYGRGITLDQLYSTASYQAHDLSGIGLRDTNLTGGNFAGQNLTNSYFYADLTRLDGADFTAADARGAELYPNHPNSADAITTNLIWPRGSISGLDLDARRLLVVRDYDGHPLSPQPTPIPITVDEHFAMSPGGTLRMAFEADAWDSTISFAPGIPVTLGGTLELTFADDVNPASQLGRTFDLFDWTGVTPTGAFTVSSRYVWDLSNLYKTGEVTLTAIPEPRALLPLSFALAALVTMGRMRPSCRSTKGENQ